MNIRPVLLSVCFACILFLSGCLSFGSRDFVLTEKDSGRTLHLNKGDTLTLHLNANPSTGYLWKFGSPPYDESVVILRGDRYTHPAELLAGSPGKRVLTFVPSASGRTGIRLIYVRPWEKGAAPAKEFNLLLIVKDGSEEEGGRYKSTSRRNYRGEEVPRFRR